MTEGLQVNPITNVGLAEELAYAEQPFRDAAHLLKSMGAEVNDQEYDQLIELGHEAGRLSGLKLIDSMFRQLFEQYKPRDPYFCPYNPPQELRRRAAPVLVRDDSKGLRESVVNRIVSVVATSSIFTRAYLLEETQYSRPTIAIYLDKFIEAKLVREVPPGDSDYPKGLIRDLDHFQRTHVLDAYIARHQLLPAIKLHELQKFIGPNREVKDLQSSTIQLGLLALLNPNSHK